MRLAINQTTAPVKSSILKLAGGMLFGLFAMSAFNAVDTFFVGRLGATQLAAMSFTFPVVMILNSISFGLGIGISSTVSRALGAGDTEAVKRLTTDGLILSMLIVLILGVLGLFTIRPLFALLGAGGDTLDYIQQYMTVWYLGIPFVIIPMAGNNVIRATGDTIMPSVIMMISVAVNVILDPLFIFGIGSLPGLGITGAAIATVIARFASLVFSLYILIHREKLVSTDKVPFSKVKQSWKSITYVGVPAALMQAINPLSLSILTGLLAGFGDSVVAGFGAAGRVEMIIMNIPMAFGSVMGPFAGQNWGANKVERIKEGAKFSALITLVWGALIFVLSLLFSHQIISLFSKDSDVIRVGSKYLITLSVGYGFLGILQISTQSMNGIGKPMNAGMVTLLKAFGLNIPLALIFSQSFQESGIFFASSISNIIAGVVGYLMLDKLVLSPRKVSLRV